MDQPIISIIVPCYNVEIYLHQCVDSLIYQTYENIEIILVDDGSKDKTPQICDEYAQKDSRIKVIHKPNGGLVSARNAGYEIANGEWLMYLDGDDWIDLDTCEQLQQYLQKYNDIDIAFWKCIQELENLSIKGKWEWRCKDKEHLYQNEECHELARHTLIYKSGIATAYCKLIRTEYAKKNKIFHDHRLKQGAEGLEFSLRAFYYAKKALFINEYFNHYRFNPNSISKKIDEQNTLYLTECFKVIEEKINQFPEKESFKIALYQRVCYALIAIAMSTYFHPLNKESLYNKIRSYKNVIKEYSLYRDAIRYCNTKGMDKQRKLTLFFIRTQMYFMLALIASLKQYFLKKGKFNY